VLAGEFGYAGDTRTYDDAQNANLMRVIDRRKGLPVALGILFIHAGESVGWPVAGLSFPFYFLIRLEDGGARTVLDPFKGGAALDTHGMREILHRMSDGRMELKPEFYEPVTKREVLMRLQNNLKTRALESGNLARGAEILRRMVSFAPMYMSLWRELAHLEARRGNLNDAFAAAEAYFDRAETNSQRHDAAALMEHLRKQRN
jgi:regulator of sirC expression with transglutaminase-like and TPR domain